MKTLALILAMTAAIPAHAGGPVIIEEAYEAIPAPRLTPGEKIAIAAGLILVIGLIGTSGGSDGPAACACNGDEPPDGGGSCAC